MTLSQITPSSQALDTTTIQEYLPEPSTTGMGAFQDVLQTASGYTSGALSTISGGAITAVDIGGFQQLLSMQMQAQMEMQQVSLLSNVEKSRHETKMTPIRNIRVG